jgi:tight adherence protein B
MIWLITLLFALCASGLVYVIAAAMTSGAEEYSGAFSKDTAKQFEDVFLFVPARRILELSWAAAAVVFMIVFLALANFESLDGVILALVLGALAGMGGFCVPRWMLALFKARRLERFNAQLSDTLTTMSNALRAGFSITQAFETVVATGENPIAQEFNLMLQQVRVGVPLADALSNMDAKVGSVDLTLVVMAIATARRTGGNLTEIFDSIAVTIRERSRIEGRIHTMTAQGRMQGIVVGAMPLVVALAMLAVDPGMMLPFLRSSAGMVACFIVVVLVAVGGLLIRKIVRIDV